MLRARHRLKATDALRRDAAIRSGRDELWTSHSRLNKAAAARLEIVVSDQTQ